MADQAEPERIHVLDEIVCDAGQDPAQVKRSPDQEGTAITITLDPGLAARLKGVAQREGLSPEALAVTLLRERLLPPIEPRDEWERRLLAIGTDCGVSLSDEALS